MIHSWSFDEYCHYVEELELVLLEQEKSGDKVRPVGNLDDYVSGRKRYEMV